MDLFEAIHHRRSIRAYTRQPVGTTLIESILKAGMSAPSAGNEQPWCFLVIRDAASLVALSTSHPYAAMVQQAPVAILPCADLELVKHRDYWPQDLAACVQNMLLAAHALGLGSVWVGVYPRESRLAEVRRVIPFPDHILPFAILPIGFPAESLPPEDRFDQTRIHLEHWQHERR
jgi:nitroreductase